MTIRASRNRSAFFYMLLAVLGWSTVPLVIDLAGAADNPFLFNFAWTLASSIGIFLFLATRHRMLLVQPTVRSTIFRYGRSWMFLALVATEFDLFLFAWSFRYIDSAVATILFDMSPLIMIPAGLILFRQEGRFRDTTSAIVIPVGLAFLGLVFVTISQVVDGGIDLQKGDARSQAIGMLIGLTAATAFGLKIPLAIRLGAHIRAALEPDFQGDDTEIFSVLVFSLVSVIPVLPLFALGAAVTGGLNIIPGLVSIGLIAGIVIGSSTRILRRQANILTSNLGINAMSYATPIMALTWLFIFATVEVYRLDYLVLGATAIIAANLLINFQAEIRFGFRSLILALWACGAFVYFRGGLAEHLELDDWLWPPGEYFTAVGLAATVFTLILSFRVARLVTRTSDETNRAFALFSRIDLLASRGVIADEARGYILRIDAHENATDLADAYRSARSSIRGAYQATTADVDRRELAEAAAEVDALAHSRQEGQDFGEYVALVVFAVITVALILLSLDAEATGWNGFLIEMFTILFSAVIIFLVVNVWDLQRERGAAVLRPEADSEGYGVVFRDAVGRRFEQVVSIVVVLAMTAAYGWLLWGKWLG